MINKIVTGRLGNQMFQYAAVRAYKDKYNIEDKINLDFTLVRRDGKKEDGFFNQLDFFNLSDDVIYDKKIEATIFQKILIALYFFGYKIIKLFSKKDKYIQRKIRYEKKIQKFLNKNGLFLYSYGYFDFNKTNKKNTVYLF